MSGRAGTTRRKALRRTVAALLRTHKLADVVEILAEESSIDTVRAAARALRKRRDGPRKVLWGEQWQALLLVERARPEYRKRYPPRPGGPDTAKDEKVCQWVFSKAERDGGIIFCAREPTGLALTNVGVVATGWGPERTHVIKSWERLRTLFKDGKRALVKGNPLWPKLLEQELKRAQASKID
jgi:hypothetical protein